MMTRRTVGLGVAGAAAAAGLSKLFGGASEAAPGQDLPVSLPEEEWKKMLTPEQYYVLRQHGTERAGTSRSITRSAKAPSPARAAAGPSSPPTPKFDSGTGWPSF